MTAARLSTPSGFGCARDALPVEQEAHEVRGRHRLDLRAQRLDGVAVDAREQAALAPFERGVAELARPRASLASSREAAAQHETFAFELHQRDVDFRRRQGRATRARSRAVTGPEACSRPRTRSVMACSRCQTFAAFSGGALIGGSRRACG